MIWPQNGVITKEEIRTVYDVNACPLSEETRLLINSSAPTGIHLLCHRREGKDSIARTILGLQQGEQARVACVGCSRFVSFALSALADCRPI